MKITVLHPDLRLHGGAERYAHSVIQTLRQLGHDVEIWDITTVLGPSVGKMIAWIPRLTLLKYALVCAIWRALGNAQSVLVHTFAQGPKDGTTTISILHAPNVFGTDDDSLKQNMVHPHWMRRGYVALCRWLVRPAPASVYITNSPWTYQRLEETIQPQTTIIPPPVPTHITPTPQTEDHSFIMISRLAPSKRLDLAIEAFDLAVQQRPTLTLMIFGTPSGATYRRLRQAARSRPWLRLCSGDDEAKSKCLSRARFGLHTAENEHFGIAICEMIASGCLTFSHHSGSGPDLIQDPRFLFTDAADLAHKILAAVDLNDHKHLEALHAQQTGALFRSAQRHDEHLRAFFKTHLSQDFTCSSA